MVSQLNTPSSPVWETDFPVQTFDLVSPELPSGSAWAVNCLLESGISAWQPWDVKIENEWHRTAPYKYQYMAQHEPWFQTLPALQFGRQFQFDASHACRASHRWAGTINTENLVLFVRDPRDMLYSHWRRHCYNHRTSEMSLVEFLQSQFHHFPCTYAEYVQLYLMLWLNGLSQFNHHLMKFEDYRLDAKSTLQRLYHFLGINRADACLTQAIQSSDFKVVQAREHELNQAGRLQRKFNFAGQAYEYLTHDPTAFDAFVFPEFNAYCEMLGYEPFASPKNNQLNVRLHSEDWRSKMVNCMVGGNPNSPYAAQVNKILKQFARLHVQQSTMGAMS